MKKGERYKCLKGFTYLAQFVDVVIFTKGKIYEVQDGDFIIADNNKKIYDISLTKFKKL